MTNIYSGECHCGAVRFEVNLSKGLTGARRCNCSYCRMRGAVVVMAEQGDLTIIEGDHNLTSYRFHSRTVVHFFCRTCGIYTHHQRRSDPTAFAVNVACLDGVSPFDFPEVPVSDGENHPSDTGLSPRRVGVLRFDWEA